MTDSQILQLFGIAYFVAGMGVVLNPKFCKKIFEKYIHDLPSIYLNGFLMLVLGFVIVTLRPWPEDFRQAVVSAIGWVAFAKGVFMLLMPETYISLSKNLRQKHDYFMLEALTIVFLGMILMVVGIL